MLSTLRASVRAKINEPVASIWTDGDINLNINNAKKDLYLAIRTTAPKIFIKSGQLNVTNATGEYELPSDFSSLYWIHAKGFNLVPQFSNRDSFKILTEESNYTYANPIFYDIYSTNDGKNIIKFAPPFTATVDYRYMSTLPDLVNDTDVLPFEELFEPFITNRAAFYCLLAMPSGEYARYEKLAAESLSQILNAVASLEIVQNKTVQEF